MGSEMCIRDSRGRGYQGRGGRGGRRQGRGQGTNSSRSTYEPKRKRLEDYIFTIGSAKQASDFVVVSKYLINHIRKTYTNGGDIGDALEAREEKNFARYRPSLQLSDDSDPDIIARENREYEMLFEAEIASFIKRKDTYKSNTDNAYALLFSHCNKAMQNKIQELSLIHI